LAQNTRAAASRIEEIHGGAELGRAFDQCTRVRHLTLGQVGDLHREQHRHPGAQLREGFAEADAAHAHAFGQDLVEARDAREVGIGVRRDDQLVRGHDAHTFSNTITRP
jgi:hypothetical protein